MSSADRVRDRDDRVNDEENYQARVNDCACDAQRTGHEGLLIGTFGKGRRASVLDRGSAPCPRRNRAEKADEEQAQKSKNHWAGAGDIACLQRRGGRRVGELRRAELGLGAVWGCWGATGVGAGIAGDGAGIAEDGAGTCGTCADSAYPGAFIGTGAVNGPEFCGSGCVMPPS